MKGKRRADIEYQKMGSKHDLLDSELDKHLDEIIEDRISEGKDDEQILGEL